MMAMTQKEMTDGFNRGELVALAMDVWWLNGPEAMVPWTGEVEVVGEIDDEDPAPPMKIGRPLP